MKFYLDKWYADLVMPDGTVCVAYFSLIRCGPLRHSYSGAEIFWPDGEREMIRPSCPTGHRLEPGSALGREVRFACTAGEFRLRYESTLDAWRPSESLAPGLEWWVEMPRAHCDLWWPGTGQKLSGIGYVDHVRLEQRLGSIGLERLDWGRAHIAEGCLVYCGVSLRSGARWQVAAWWGEGEREPRVFDQFSISPRNESLMFCTSPEWTEATTLLTPERQLHAGPIVEAAPIPGLRERLAARLIAGRLSDNRWISRARPLHGSGAHADWAVHEVVGLPGRTDLAQ